jgi:hypothetical protein
LAAVRAPHDDDDAPGVPTTETRRYQLGFEALAAGDASHHELRSGSSLDKAGVFKFVVVFA